MSEGVAEKAPVARSSATLGARFDGWFRDAVVPERLAALRILIGAFAVIYSIVRFNGLTSVTRLNPADYRPVGVIHLQGGLLPDAVVYGATALMIVAGVAFVLGAYYRITAPLFAVLLLWLLSYRNSFGMIFHTENLMVLHVLVLAVSPAADAWSFDARRRRKAPGPPLHAPSRHYGWPIRVLSIITVGAYLLAGIAKLQNTGLTWVTSDVLRNYVAHDNLRKMMLGDWYAPLGGFMVRYPMIFKPLAGLSLVMELVAPLALLGGRVSKLWVASAWGFHLGVWAVMAIFFPYPLLGLAFLSFFAVERPMAKLIARFSRSSGSSAQPTGAKA